MNQRLGFYVLGILFLVACGSDKQNAASQTPLPTSLPWGVSITLHDPLDGEYFDDSKLTAFTDLIPAAWVTITDVPSRYELALQPQLIEVERCAFSLESPHDLGRTPRFGDALTPESSKTVYIYRQQVDVMVTITDLNANSQLGEQTFRGDAPQPCVGMTSFQTINGMPMSKTYQGEVNSTGFEAWLMETMSQLPDLTATPTLTP